MKSLIFSLLLAAMLGGCGGDDAATSTSTSTSTSYIGTISGGEAPTNTSLMSTNSTSSSEDLGMWSISLNPDGTFNVKNASVLDVSGTYESLDSGFVKLTATSVNGETPSEEMTAYGLNVPGLIFFLAPINETGVGEIIPMVKSGSCPTSSTDLLWTIVGASDSTDNQITRNCVNAGAEGSDIFGSATITASSLELPAKYDICNNSLGATTAMDFSCTSGVGTILNGSTVEAYMYLTEGGGAIVKTDPNGTDEKTIVALEKEDSLGYSDIEGVYAGILFIESESSDLTKPVKATIADNKIVITEWDVDTNTEVSDGASGTIHTISDNTPGAGFIHGKIDVGADQTDSSIHAFVTCQADLDANSSGKNIIVCAGQEPDESTTISLPGEGSDNSFSLVLVEK